MSAFNGMAHLDDQVESILDQQTPGPLRLLIRDDGSSDGSLPWLTGLDDERVEVIAGENLGVKASFLWLLEEARRRPWQYLALADQDDVWLPGKLDRAIDRLGSPDNPALYCSALQLVDASLSPLGQHRHRGRIDFQEGFLDNAVTGCSCVVTRGLFEQLHALPRAQAIHMHDWWLYLVALSFGHVVYDPESRILHRQHGHNVNGMPRGLARVVTVLSRRYGSERRVSRARQAGEFLRLHEPRLPEGRRRYLEKLSCSGESLAGRLDFAIRRWPASMKGAAGVASRLAFAVGIT